MATTAKNIYIVLLLVLISNHIAAQDKIGVVDIDKVIDIMSETKLANISLVKFQDSLQKEYEALEKKIQEAANKYNNDTLCHMFVTDPELAVIERRTITQDIVKFMSLQEEHQMLLKKKAAATFDLVKNKIIGVIKKIAGDNGYNYVLDFSDQRLQYLPLPKYDNITDLILCKLNL